MTTFNQEMTAENLATLSKEELIAIIMELTAVKAQKSHKKFDALAILKEGPATILEIANKMNISTKNVSSLLTYLRRDGITIYTDNVGRKFIPKS